MKIYFEGYSDQNTNKNIQTPTFKNSNLFNYRIASIAQQLCNN